VEGHFRGKAGLSVGAGLAEGFYKRGVVISKM